MSVKTLRSLNLSALYENWEPNKVSKGVGPVGAAALGEALKSNTSLQELNLAGNKIRDAGAIALADAQRKTLP